MYRTPYSRAPFSAGIVTVLLAAVSITAKGGGYKIGYGGATAAVIVTAYGAGVIVDAKGGSKALVDIIANAGGVKIAEDLYFIDEPRIQTQGVLATHITVRSPSAEAVATVSPVPPDENKIERLIDIDEGDEVMCQAVADELLEKWGKEQLSITGRVPLVVTLRFKEYARVFVPSINLEEFLILQRKEHNLESYETRVTLGDIILGDSELLARILEELQKGRE